MIYRNAEIKVEQFVTYFNNKKINLSPVFQRGHVWSVSQRKKLLKNMILTKPIPAIFLYKEAKGSSFTYIILDGKQRLESLILFIANKRNDLAIKNWADYFYRKLDKKDVNYSIELEGKKVTFEKVSDDIVRTFGEYVVPTIEITLDENTTLDDIISLFVDINQQGVAVKRFDIVKAMCRSSVILKQTFDMIAIKQKRRQDTHYKMKDNESTFVLKKLSTIAKAPESNSRVDRMWERLLEIAIFSITLTHKKPVDVLKGFIKSGEVGEGNKLNIEHKKILKEVFSFLKRVYSQNTFSESKLATDGTHFYTMVTTLIKNHDLRNMQKEKLTSGLVGFAEILNNERLIKSQSKIVKPKILEYLELSSKHTTDVSRRSKREELFAEIVTELANK